MLPITIFALGAALKVAAHETNSETAVTPPGIHSPTAIGSVDPNYRPPHGYTVMTICTTVTGAPKETTNALTHVKTTTTTTRTLTVEQASNTSSSPSLTSTLTATPFSTASSSTTWSSPSSLQSLPTSLSSSMDSMNATSSVAASVSVPPATGAAVSLTEITREQTYGMLMLAMLVVVGACAAI